MAAPDDSPRAVRRWLALALCVGVATVLVVLLARSAVGAVQVQPAAWQVAVWTAIVCAAAMAAWRLDDVDRTDHDSTSRLARAAAALCGGLLFGLLLARSSSAGIAAVVVITLSWAVACLGRVLRFWRPLAAALELSNTPVGQSSECAGITGAFDDALRIQLQRRSTSDGETIEIQARLEFPAGAREAVLHVPLWPVLAADPEVECEPLDSDDLQLRVTSAERYGIRLEGRLPSAAVLPRSVPIGIQIQAAPGDRISSAA